MISTCAPQASQNAFSFATAPSSAPGSGVRIVQRPSNSSAKPDSGPEYSVPAIGWPGMKWTPSGTCGPISRTTALFTEPASVRIAPGCEVRRDFRRERAECADRRAKDHKVRALDGIGGVLVDLVGKLKPAGGGACGLAAGAGRNPCPRGLPAAWRGLRTSQSGQCRSAPLFETSVLSSSTVPARGGGLYKSLHIHQKCTPVPGRAKIRMPFPPHAQNRLVSANCGVTHGNLGHHGHFGLPWIPAFAGMTPNHWQLSLMLARMIVPGRNSAC